MNQDTKISASSGDEDLKEKLKLAEAVIGRAQESLQGGDLSVEHRRYLNVLLTNIVVSEQTMCW